MSTLVDFIRTHWHEVPDEAVIPDDMEFAIIWTGGRQITHYAPGETGTDFRQAGCRFPRFTPEPLPEPEPEPAFVLPTEPGSVVIAHTGNNRARRTFLLGCGGWWADGRATLALPSELIDPEPARVVPNGIGVMDETDKRDRLDADGAWWYWNGLNEVWNSTRDVYGGNLANVAKYFGPLRFAGEGGVPHD